MSEPSSGEPDAQLDPQLDPQVRTLFERDVASRSCGMRLLEVRQGYARVRMPVRADMANGHGVCHGGMIFTLADSAFAFACNAGRSLTLASGASVEFLRPARPGDELTAIAEERSRGRRSGVYDVRVSNQSGECVALFRGRSHELSGDATS